MDINALYHHCEHISQQPSNMHRRVWDLIGDQQLFYWLPAICNYSYQVAYCSWLYPLNQALATVIMR